ncbi:MAG TPA: SDR family oxidoreductase [Thermoanaerobaculia bacterium]|nr:SDR family oxidoreductase [Thermoanaerobaculia bacterium]
MHNTDVICITGASKGLGLALARLFARRGNPLIINARGEELHDVERELAGETEVVAVRGDVSEIAEEIAAAGLARFGRVDILINNASELGPSPMPLLTEHAWQSLERIFRINVIAPIHLIQLLRPATIVNITSDAAVNAYPHWGGYGASKAALEHASRILAKELEGSARVLIVDPGDMNTEMHRLAEPGVDLSSLPSPEAVAPKILERIYEVGEHSPRFQVAAGA